MPSGPLPLEVEDNDFPDLPRLVVDFNRRDFGRLKSLIDAINRILERTLSRKDTTFAKRTSIKACV